MYIRQDRLKLTDKTLGSWYVQTDNVFIILVTYYRTRKLDRPLQTGVCISHQF